MRGIEVASALSATMAPSAAGTGPGMSTTAGRSATQLALSWGRSRSLHLLRAIRSRQCSGYSSRGWREMNDAMPGTVNATRPCSGA